MFSLESFSLFGRHALVTGGAGHFAGPEDIVGAAAFLCSGAAAYVKGSVVTVDGGWLAR